VFGIAYLVVRILHLALYAGIGRGDPRTRGAVWRVAPTELGAAGLLVVAGGFHGDARLAIWVLAISIDYLLRPEIVGSRMVRDPRVHGSKVLAFWVE
jgi:low temperature requirement protein LtrA